VKEVELHHPHFESWLETVSNPDDEVLRVDDPKRWAVALLQVFPEREFPHLVTNWSSMLQFCVELEKFAVWTSDALFAVLNDKLPSTLIYGRVPKVIIGVRDVDDIASRLTGASDESKLVEKLQSLIAGNRDLKVQLERELESESQLRSAVDDLRARVNDTKRNTAEARAEAESNHVIFENASARWDERLALIADVEATLISEGARFIREIVAARKLDTDDMPDPDGVEAFRYFAQAAGTRIKWVAGLDGPVAEPPA
jgi:hypothetical protein